MLPFPPHERRHISFSFGFNLTCIDGGTHDLILKIKMILYVYIFVPHSLQIDKAHAYPLTNLQG